VNGLQAEAFVEVPFQDVDMLEVAWHGHYLKYFEAARGALLRKLDYDYAQMRESGYAWPVVEAQIKYLRPARYGQKLKVVATLLEYENRLKMGFEIFDAASAERLTRGHCVQVAVDVASGELQIVSPDALLMRVQQCLQDSSNQPAESSGLTTQNQIRRVP
jgi:acyl-CoA thioester hydrolase